MDKGAGFAERIGRTCLPRLPSMKNSGGEAEGRYPDHVLHLLGRDAEVARDLSEAVAGLEAVDEVLDARAAVHDERLTERLARVDRDLGSRVGRQSESLGPVVVAVGDALGYPRIISAKCCWPVRTTLSSSSSSLCAA